MSGLGTPHFATMNQATGLPSSIHLMDGFVPEVWLPSEPSHLIIVGQAQSGKSTANEAAVDAVNAFTDSEEYAGLYENSRIYRAASYLASTNTVFDGQDVDQTVADFAQMMRHMVEEGRTGELASQLKNIIGMGNVALRSDGAELVVPHLSKNQKIRDHLEGIGVQIMSRMLDDGNNVLVVNGRNTQELQGMSSQAGAKISLGTLILECDPGVAAKRARPHAARAEQQVYAAQLHQRNHEDSSRQRDPATTRQSAKVLGVVDELPSCEEAVDQLAWEMGSELASLAPTDNDVAIVIRTDSETVTPIAEQHFVRTLVLAALHTAAVREQQLA